MAMCARSTPKPAREMPGVRAVITVARSGRGGDQEHAGGGGQTPRRLADAAAAAASAGDRSRSLCRRTDRDGRGGDQQAGQGCGRGDLRRYRSVAGGHDRQRRGGRRMRRCCTTKRPATSAWISITATAEKVAAAFAQAAHVTKLAIRNNRIVVCPMEPRSAIGEYDAEADRLILRLGCQGVFGQRNLVSGILGIPVEKLRVLTGNVGGSFGMKASAYPEYICLLHAARTLGQPVKWTDERSESFMSDSHGRDHEMTAELALDSDGKISGAAGDRVRQSRCLAEQRDDHPADHEHGEEHHRRLCHAADRGLDEMHVHQHDAGRRLSRRGPARGQLLHGAPGRDRGARDGHRPGGVAPAQSYPAGADAIPGTVRHAV